MAGSGAAAPDGLLAEIGHRRWFVIGRMQAAERLKVGLHPGRHVRAWPAAGHAVVVRLPRHRPVVHEVAAALPSRPEQEGGPRANDPDDEGNFNVA